MRAKGKTAIVCKNDCTTMLYFSVGKGILRVEFRVPSCAPMMWGLGCEMLGEWV